MRIVSWCLAILTAASMASAGHVHPSAFPSNPPSSANDLPIIARHRASFDDRSRAPIERMLTAAPARSECEPGWLPTFGARPGASRPILAVTMFDDGTGPAIYAAGRFTRIGNTDANRIAKWDGNEWTPLGEGLNHDVESLAVFDDGSGAGSALYVGGWFTTAGGVSASGVAKWDGKSWSAVGGGIDNGDENDSDDPDEEPAVRVLRVFDDGDNPALFAGGRFETAGGVSASCIAKWDGVSWSALGAGVDDWVNDLMMHDDGSGDGPALYAGGHFLLAGGVRVNRIARWNGAEWSALGNGLSEARADYVDSLATYRCGADAEECLIAGGRFTLPHANRIKNIAGWNGQSWMPLAEGFAAPVHGMTTFNDGSGADEQLYVATRPSAGTGMLRRWDGESWMPLDLEPGKRLLLLAVLDDDSTNTPQLFGVGESDTTPGGSGTIVRWDKDAQMMVQFDGGLNGVANALVFFDDGRGDGPALYAGGTFTSARGVRLNRIGKWNHELRRWTPLGTGFNGSVEALIVFDDESGGGPALYAGGSFTKADGADAYFIARWDGASWSPVAGGMDGPVSAFAIYDEGSNGDPALFAGGAFNYAGSTTAFHVARWDGSAWSALGGGTNAAVHELTVFDFDNEEGPGLFAAGEFTTAGGESALRVARWDGTQWFPLGGGVGPAAYAGATVVYALAGCATCDDDGPALYAGGYFNQAGGAPSTRLARWNGNTWSPMTGGPNGLVEGIFAMLVVDEPELDCEALYVGGFFTSIGGIQVNSIARWDGNAWSALGAGVTSPFDFVLSLASFNNGEASEPAIYAGGNFRSVSSDDSYLARWQQCPRDALLRGDMNGDGVVDGDDLLELLGAWGMCGAPCPPTCDADIAGGGGAERDCIIDVFDLIALLAHWSEAGD